MLPKGGILLSEGMNEGWLPNTTDAAQKAANKATSIKIETINPAFNLLLLI